MTNREFFNARKPESTGAGSALLDVIAADHVFDDSLIAAGGLRVTGEGDVKFTAVNGMVDTWPCSDFDYIPIAIKRVWAAPATTATGIHAIY